MRPGDRALSRACVPEMKKAFQFDACHTDRVLIARYDDTGGYFRRHRDNSSPAVAFRQFALSVNLNSEEYEGGTLSSPNSIRIATSPVAAPGSSSPRPCCTRRRRSQGEAATCC